MSSSPLDPPPAFTPLTPGREPGPPAPGPRPRSRLPIAAIAAVALVIALSGAGYAGYRFLLGHDDRLTAGYVPKSAYGYVAVNTDPTSRAWADAWALMRRAGIDDDLARLPERTTKQAGKDASTWDALIKPAIGGEVGLAVWSAETSGGATPRLAAIVLFSDEGKARQAIEALLADEQPTAASHRGVDYQVDRQGNAVGIVDRAIVVTPTREAFADVVDAHLDGALAAEPLFGWFDMPAISKAMQETIAADLPGGGDALSTTLDQYAALGVTTLTVKADDGALRAIVLAADRSPRAPTTKASDEFAGEMPASSLLYLASSDLYHTVWQPIVDQLGRSTGEGLLPFGPSGDALAASTGVDLERDLLAPLTGRYGVALGLEQDGDGRAWQVHFASQVDDEQAVRDALDRAAAQLEAAGAPLRRSAGGFRLEEGRVNAELIVTDRVLRVRGTFGQASGAGNLVDDPDYQRAMARMPADATTVLYVALPRIVDLIPADAWDGSDQDLRPLVEALGPLAYASGPDGAGERTEVALFLQEK